MRAEQLVVVLWDMATCPPTDAVRSAKAIKAVMRRFGTVRDFRALGGDAAMQFGVSTRQALMDVGLSFVDVSKYSPSEDSAAVLELFCMALDHRAPATIVAVTGDRSVDVALRQLVDRKYHVVTVAPRGFCGFEAPWSLCDWESLLAFDAEFDPQFEPQDFSEQRPMQRSYIKAPAAAMDGLRRRGLSSIADVIRHVQGYRHVHHPVGVQIPRDAVLKSMLIGAARDLSGSSKILIECNEASKAGVISCGGQKPYEWVLLRQGQRHYDPRGMQKEFCFAQGVYKPNKPEPWRFADPTSVARFDAADAFPDYADYAPYGDRPYDPYGDVADRDLAEDGLNGGARVFTPAAFSPRRNANRGGASPAAGRAADDDRSQPRMRRFPQSLTASPTFPVSPRPAAFESVGEDPFKSGSVLGFGSSMMPLHGSADAFELPRALQALQARPAKAPGRPAEYAHAPDAAVGAYFDESFFA
ncbi:hypothetical protein M885DRAFT_529519 [Pelagophyceae sp. CCMP2097]|nr:hypothetical protein M885DRAFT_529519 [Pelagophyceae sp. CCMP2097]|mmetsp:Transcript_11401/g.38073  ORF Transcript_11401/g.38073 Transcript_11401/m.38073 type:complete len:471 (+) Transcript_11401:125-1537(+)